MAAGIMGGLALVMFQLSKNQTNAQIKSKISADIAQLKSELTLYLTTPSHCNANFFGKTGSAAPGTSYSPTAVYQCTGGGCKAAVGTGNSVAKITVVAPGSSFTSAAGVADVRARLVGLSYSITNPNYPAGTVNAISIIPVLATIQTKEPGATVSGSSSTTINKTQQITISVPVVMTNAGNTVTGCPTSLNSTVP